MIINKIRLENIRSYINQEVNLPIGSVLLWGDVGCGKSTLLLALDFALFGLQRGVLDGNALLRNGSNKGSVEVELEIEGKKVFIKRGLKRSNDAVGQDTGYIIIDGIKKEGSAVELKQAVLDLLNYPANLLTKSKSLIYRYTVYTPQEEMKAILFGDNETRVDILRKIFGVDKYKLVKENSKIYNSKLRERIKLLEVKIENLESKKIERERIQEQINNKEVNLNEIYNKLKVVKEQFDHAKLNIEESEKNIHELNKIKHEIEVNENSLKHKVEEKKRNNETLEKLQFDKLKYEKEIDNIENFNEEDLKIFIESANNELRLMEDTLRNVTYRINEADIKIKTLTKDRDDVIDLDKCPSCKQVVTIEYKNNFIKNIQEKLNILRVDKKNYDESEKNATDRIGIIKKKLDELKETKRNADVFKIKKENLDNILERIKEINENNELLKEDVGQINLKNSELYNKIRQYENIEEKYKEEKKLLEDIRERENEIRIEKEKISVELNNLIKKGRELREEIHEGVKVKEKITYLTKIRTWLDGNFINLVNTIEKQIMLRVYHDFNGLFIKWFDTIMNNEVIKVKLDYDFKPLVQQNGYDIDYNHLSGGEKTAAALAYRLALNQVINKLMAVIKTKDLLILDEPTDGFSDEQLDRIGNVLEELDMKQLIIVSHENKVESFVENVIKFNKKEHVSEAVV